MYISKLQKYLNPTTWTNYTSLSEIQLKIIDFIKDLQFVRYSKESIEKNSINDINIQFNNIMKDFSILCCYINDDRYGIGLKKISLWLMLEISLIYPSLSIGFLNYLQLCYLQLK